MATPTNPILISQLTVEAVSVNAGDHFLIEQGGVYKKITGANLTSGGLWSKNGNDIYYNTNFVGVGLNLTYAPQTGIPTVPLDVSSMIHGKQQVIQIQAPTSDKTGLVISTGAGAGHKAGWVFSLDLGTIPKWFQFLDVDEDSLNISYLTTAGIRFKLLADGGVVVTGLPTSAGVSNSWWNNAGTVNISP